MIVTSNAMVIRLHIENISMMGRYTQGVRLINVKENEEVTTVARIELDDETAIDETMETEEE